MRKLVFCFVSLLIGAGFGWSLSTHLHKNVLFNSADLELESLEHASVSAFRSKNVDAVLLIQSILVERVGFWQKAGFLDRSGELIITGTYARAAAILICAHREDDADVFIKKAVSALEIYGKEGAHEEVIKLVNDLIFCRE